MVNLELQREYEKIVINIENGFLVNDNEFKNWRKILFLSVLSLVMIASGHAADRKIFILPN